MARRSQDVELVIKARDEAQRVLDSLNDGLKELTQNQEKAGRSADKTGDLVSQLGTEFQDLNKQLQGLAALGKISAELDRAAGAVNKVDSEVKSAATELAKLARESESAAQRTNRLRAQIETETRTRDENNVSLRASKKELTEVDRLLKQVESSQSKLSRANASFKPTAGVGIEAGAANTSARASAATFLAGDQEKLNREVAMYEANVKAASRAIKDIAPQVSAAASQQDKLSRETDRAAKSLRNQRGELASSRENLAAIRSISDQANARLGSLAGTQDKVAAASARMAAQMAAAKARIEALSTAKGPKATPVADTALAGDERAITSQRRAMLEARREWVQSQEEVRRLAQEIRKAEQPTEELGTAFGRAQAQARLAAQEYERQAQALHRLGGASQSNFRAFSQAAEQMRNAGSATRALGADAGAAVANQSRLAAATGQTAASMGRAASSTNGLRGAFGGLYGESRQAMSILQRVRGEVLSLVTAYVGLHAAIHQIRGVITAFQSIEAAQSRLGVVFNQDTARVSQELSWLNSEASRLGITFQVLSDEYGKFAVAANAANFSAESTREIFTRVAEAARVNKLSMDQMSGVFLALQQMISKGKVTSEELRRQLGDRLTGAFNIFADAIGVTTAELDEMMRKGEVIADETTLLKFAKELESRFGPQLAAALKSTTTEIGRFQNELFNAQLRVAEGGFMEALTEGLRELNEWFASREGRDFFLSLGQALGTFVSILAKIPQHLDLVKYAMLALVGVKLGSALAGIQFSFTAAAASTLTFSARLIALRASVVAVTGSLMTMRGLLVGIRGLMAGVLSVMGGIPGIIATVALIAISEWATGIDDATSALDEHKRQLGEVQAAYARAESGAKGWAKEIRNVSLLQAIDDVEKMRRELVELRNLNAPGDAFGLDTKGTVAALRAAVQAFNSGTMSAADFKAEVDRIATADPKLNRTIALQFQEVADKASIAEEAFARAEAKLRVIQGTATESDEALLGLAKAAEKVQEALNPESSEKFTASIRELASLVPELADDMRQLKEIDALEKLYLDAVNLARTMGQVNQATELYGRALDAIKNKDINKVLEGYGAGGATSSDLIKKFEGFRADPYWDVNAFRVGYGSDTVTLSDGTIRRVTEGMRVSVADANRDLARRIGEFQDTIKSEIGADRFAAFSPEQQAALTSIAYNYGNLSRTGELQAFKTGTVDEIVEAIRRLASQDGGVNAGRRNQEADIFAGGGTSYRLGQQEYEAEAAAAEKAKERAEATQKRLADIQFEIEQQKLVNDGKAKQAAIEAAIVEAKRENPEISEAELQKIREQTAALWEQKNLGEELRLQKEQAAAAEERVNQLYQLRQQLLEQQKMYQEQGDTAAAQELTARLSEVNVQLQEAIQNAIVMWQAIGGAEADAAIAKLQTTSMSIRNVGTSVNWLGLNMQQVQTLAQSFASGMAGVFDKFAMAIANGEDAVDALKDAFLQFAADFLRQIAQMIIQQAILNMLQSMFPGMGFGGGGGGGMGIMGAILRHQGGLVGKGVGGQVRAVNPGIFSNAMRYHTGGIAGLKPNEVPAILERNEEVLTTDDPRHQFNGGGAAPAAGDTKIINAFDTASFLEAALNTRVGEKAILNFVQANGAAVKAAIG